MSVPREDSRAATVDAVVTHHLNTFASGVARFNEILAERMGVPLLALFDPRSRSLTRPLLSFKVSELDARERERLSALLREVEWRPWLYLHDWSSIPLETELVEAADRVLCGNREVLERVRDLDPDAEASWTPGLLLDHRLYPPAEVTIFSFGMAHKIRTDMFRHLRDLLDRSTSSHALFVSSANHETSSIRDAQLVYEEMDEIFPQTMYFMGNLSDVAIFNMLRTTTYFAAFFHRGVRDNNTSVAAAMEQGAVVITNLDEYSPRELVHMGNVIDISRAAELPTDPLVLRQISVAAMETTRRRDWSHLVRDMTRTRVPLQ